MKKKLSLVLAVVMAASMLAGCKKTDEDSSGLPEVVTQSITAMTTIPTETTPPTTTVPPTETTEETAESTEETTETTAPSETSETTASVETTEEKTWSETEIDETFYIKQECYSRTRAIVGSESVKKYEKGTKIEVVAATDTGYYKLADGTFIHSDYVTDTPPSETTVPKTEPKPTTTTSSTEEKPKTPAKPVNSSYTKSYTDRYPYKQLTASEQKLYANIVEAAESFETTVKVPDGLLSDDIFKVYVLVFNNEPQLFWLSPTVPSGYGTINLKFDISRKDAEAMQKEIDANVAEIMRSVNSYTGTVSKLKVIYDWIVTHNTFSLQGTFATCGIYNGLTDNSELQCQGYAKSVLYLCDVAGIECMTVNGNGAHGGTHAWNIVYCVDGYYILDTTWGDPAVKYGQKNYARYLFFLANDSMISKTHSNISHFERTSTGKNVKLYTPPACTKTSCYYFKAYNKEYSDLDSAVAAMQAEIDAAIAAGKQVAHIRVTDYDLWETLTSDAYFLKFQKYAQGVSSDVSALNRVRDQYTEPVLVVQYDIKYK